MRTTFIVLLFLLLISVMVMAEDKAPTTSQVVTNPPVVNTTSDVPVVQKVDAPVVQKETTKVMPDIEKVEKIAEEQGAGWGTYGTVLALIVAAIGAFLKLKKKTPENTPKV